MMILGHLCELEVVVYEGFDPQIERPFGFDAFVTDLRQFLIESLAVPLVVSNVALIVDAVAYYSLD